MEAIEYKGYTIAEDYERNPYNKNPEIIFYPTDQGIDHDYDYDNESWRYCGNCKWVGSVEEAMDEIDEIVAENEAITELRAEEKIGEMNHLKEPQDER